MAKTRRSGSGRSAYSRRDGWRAWSLLGFLIGSLLSFGWCLACSITVDQDVLILNLIGKVRLGLEFNNE